MAAPQRKSPRLTPELLDENAPTPLYHQVYTVLRERIRTGAYPVGTLLPGEQELVRLMGVSRITVKRALNDLALAGFVRRMRGRGTIVTGGPAHPVLRGSFNTLLESLRAMGAETQVELLAAEEASAPPQVAELLDLARGAKVERAVRLRKLKGTPFSHLVTYVPLEIAAAYSREQLATTPLLTLLERAGAKATDAEQTLTAVAAPKEIADALQISAGAPLLHITRVMRDAGGRAVQVIEAHYRPDQFQYHIRLSRRQSGKEDVWSDGD